MSKQLAAVSLFAVTMCLAGCASDVLRTDRVPYQYVPPAAPPNFFVGYNVNDGRELSSANPHVVANVTPDSIGTFGVLGTAISIPVARNLCGFPPETLPRPFFMARDKNGNLRFYPGYTDAYFTFVPCH